MKVIAVDDERLILEDFLDEAERLPEIDEIHGFQNATDAIQYVEENEVHVAFLDIQMRGMNGIELADRLKKIAPNINIIFLTAYPEYSMEAMKLHASGYLLKPAQSCDIQNELRDLRFPVQEQPDKRIRIQCFGNFEIYVDQRPVEFKYAKSKELVAYLVDRKGTLCSNGEICATIWEDKMDSQALFSHFRNLVSDIRSTFNALDCGDFIIKKRGMIGIATELAECDYYRWLEGEEAAKNLYQGEYMIQYSWSEYAWGQLGDE